MQMCGRMNIIDDPITQWLSNELGIQFNTVSNNDVRPTNTVGTLIADGERSCRQLDARWGIKPSWSKKLLINAQSETAHEKRTFKEAFQQRRCLVPFSAWYEWRDEGGRRKQKYMFDTPDNTPLLMAGIYFDNNEHGMQLVTLTSSPNRQCSDYHHRMPTLITVEHALEWLHSPVERVVPMLSMLESGASDEFSIKPVA